MIDPRRQAFANYIRLIADDLGLRDWVIVVKDRCPEDPSNSAEAESIWGAKHINILIGDSLLDKDREYQREVFVHELLHAHTAHMNFVLREMLEPAQYQVHRVQMEYMVDALAVRVSKFLPLPTPPFTKGDSDGTCRPADPAHRGRRFDPDAADG